MNSEETYHLILVLAEMAEFQNWFELSNSPKQQKETKKALSFRKEKLNTEKPNEM